MYKNIIFELVEVCKQQQAILECMDKICQPCKKVNLHKSIDFDWVRRKIKKAESLLAEELTNIH